MSDEVRNAAVIGAAINKGLGSFPKPKKGKPSKKTNSKSSTSKTTVLDGELIEPSPKSTSTKEPEIYDAEVITPSKSITKDKKSISFDPYTLPTHGPGSEFNKNGIKPGRQFNG
jgi:hypothetical protein